MDSNVALFFGAGEESRVGHARLTAVIRGLVAE